MGLLKLLNFFAKGISTPPIIGADAVGNQTTPFNLFVLFENEYSLTASRVTITGGTAGTPTSSDNRFWIVPITPTVQATQIEITVLGSNQLLISSAQQEYIDYLNEIPNVSGSVPNLSERITVNAFIKYWKDYNIWTEIDRVYVTKTSGGRNTARINVKAPGTDNLVENGTLNYSNGFASDGSTGYLATGFIPSTDGVNFTLNDLGIIVYTPNVTAIDAAFDLGTNVGSLLAVNVNRDNVRARLTINQASNSDVVLTPAAGTQHIMRTASNRVAMYINGALAGSHSAASTSLPTGQLFLCALNNAGSPSSFTTRTYELLALGSNLESDAVKIDTSVKNLLLTDQNRNADLNYVNSSIDVSVTNIYIRCFYKSKQNQPLLILLAGWEQAPTDFTDATYQRFRDYGFFVAGIGVRGVSGATGTRDDSARELQDIIDAIELLKSRFPGLIDSSKISVVGYSGGGAQVLGLVSKFPDYFAVGVDFFGMSDYGYDPVFGWYQQEPTRQATLTTRIGGTPATVPNNYKSRQHLVSAKNFTGKLYIFHDTGDTSVEVNHSQRLVTELNNAGFTNYVYNETESGDPIRWLHALPNSPAQIINAEDTFKADCLSLEAQQLPTSGVIEVNGYVKTKYFTCWLGNGTVADNGRNRRATLTYNLTTNEYTIVPSIDAPDTDMTVLFEDAFGRTYSNTISSTQNFNPA